MHGSSIILFGRMLHLLLSILLLHFLLLLRENWYQHVHALEELYCKILVFDNEIDGALFKLQAHALPTVKLRFYLSQINDWIPLFLKTIASLEQWSLFIRNWIAPIFLYDQVHQWPCIGCLGSVVAIALFLLALISFYVLIKHFIQVLQMI